MTVAEMFNDLVLLYCGFFIIFAVIECIFEPTEGDTMETKDKTRAQRCPTIGHDDFIPVELLLDPDLTDEKIEDWRELQKQPREEKPEWIDIPPCLRRSTD